MASKLAAAKIAAWSGVRVVIASATRPGVLADAVDGPPGVGTVFVPREQRLPARKLWIAFAVGSSGTVVVDEGARKALVERGVSLLPAGVVAAHGRFDVRRRRRGGRPGRAGVRQGAEPPSGRAGQRAGGPADGRPAGGRASRGRAPGRPGPAAVMRRRALVVAAVVVLGVMAVGVLGGCGVVSSTLDTQQGLRDAGFQSVSVGFHLSGGSDEVDAGVKVSAPATPADADMAASIVWQKLHERFDVLKVTVHGTGPDVVQTYSFADLESMFGARNPAWNRSSIRSSAEDLGLIVLGVFAAVVVVVVVVIVLVVRRNRRRRPPPWMGGPPPWMGGPPPWMGGPTTPGGPASSGGMWVPTGAGGPPPSGAPPPSGGMWVPTGAGGPPSSGAPPPSGGPGGPSQVWVPPGPPGSPSQVWVPPGPPGAGRVKCGCRPTRRAARARCGCRRARRAARGRATRCGRRRRARRGLSLMRRGRTAVGRRLPGPLRRLPARLPGRLRRLRARKTATPTPTPTGDGARPAARLRPRWSARSARLARSARRRRP